jgi:YbbR domain-containing protein
MARTTLRRRLWTWFQDRLRSMVTVHPWFKLFSFLLALGMWLWVQGEQVIDGLVSVDVQYRWPSHLVLTSDPPEDIEAVIRGTRSEVQRARFGAVVMYIDMREATPGVQTLAFVDQDIQGLSEDVLVVNLRVRDFEVVLEPRRDKRVRVVVDTIGEPMRDYRVESVTPTPEFVWIEGPASVVEEMEEVKTLGVPLSNQQETFTVDVDLALPDDHLKRREDALIKVRVEVVESRATTRLNGVPLRAPPGWQATPETVDVLLNGPTSVLEEMGASDLLVTGSVPEDVPRVRLKVQSSTFQVVHGGRDSLAIEDVFPDEVIFTPLASDPPEVPSEPEEPAEPAPEAP